jgi:uncharacterized membrane protein
MAPLSLFAVLSFFIAWRSISQGLGLAVLDPVAMAVVPTVAVISLSCAWLLSIGYLTEGPQSLVKASAWPYWFVVAGGLAGGYGAMQFAGPASLYGFGVLIFLPLAHLLMARHFYVRRNGKVDQ